MTFAQAFQEIKYEPIRRAIIKNMIECKKDIPDWSHFNSKIPSHIKGLHMALAVAFYWEPTPQGLHYWDGVSEMLRNKQLI